MAKNWSDLRNFYSKVTFLEFLSKEIYFTFLCWFELLMFHNNIVKISEKLNKRDVENLPPIYLPYRFLHLQSFVLWEKVKIFDLLKTSG